MGDGNIFVNDNPHVAHPARVEQRHVAHHARVEQQQPTRMAWQNERVQSTTHAHLNEDDILKAQLTRMGVPAADIEAMHDPAVKRVLQVLIRGQPTPAEAKIESATKVEDSPTRKTPSASTSQNENTPNSERPSKRARRAPEPLPEIPRTVLVKYARYNPPSDPSAIAPPSKDDLIKMELTKEALEHVNFRLRGREPGYEAADYVKPCDRTNDPEIKVYLDYDQGVCMLPDHTTESADERAERSMINRHIWKTFRTQYEADIRNCALTTMRSKGFIMVEGRCERPNDLFNVGYLFEPVAWYRETNTVYYGSYTHDMMQHTMSRSHGNSIFQGPINDAVYQCAPRGYPHSREEIDQLNALCRNVEAPKLQRTGAHILLRAFYNAARRIDISMRDDSLNAILTPEAYDPSYFPECLTRATASLPFDMLRPSSRRASDGSHDGYGLPCPTEAFNVVDWATYIAVHHSVGSANRITGINMDYAGRVRFENVYAYLLVRALGPAYEQDKARAAYTMHFAYLVARPHLYEERIEEYNTRSPLTPYVEAPGPTFTVEVSTLTNPMASNFSSHDLSDHLIRNGVPVRIIHHCYAYGRQFLDQSFYNVGRVHISRTINDERVDRLKRYGQPPTMNIWTGWFTPAFDTIRRIKYLYFHNPKSIDLDNPYWTRYGADHAPVTLASVRNVAAFDIPQWTGADTTITITTTLNKPDAPSLPDHQPTDVIPEPTPYELDVSMTPANIEDVDRSLTDVISETPPHNLDVSMAPTDIEGVDLPLSPMSAAPSSESGSDTDMGGDEDADAEADEDQELVASSTA